MEHSTSVTKINSRSIILLVVIIGLFVASIILLVYLLQDMDWRLIRQTSLTVLTLILILTLLGNFTYTLLVYLLVRSSGYVTSLWKTYLILNASLSANYVTPVKVGFPLRIYLYEQIIGIPFTTGTVLIAVETLVGLLLPAFLSLLGIAFLFPFLGLATPLILIGLLVLILTLVFITPVEYLRAYLQQLPLKRFTLRLINFFQHVRDGLRCMSPTVVLGVIGLNFIMLSLQTLRLWLVLGIFDQKSSPLTLLIILVVSITAGNLSMIPLGLGVRDASFILLLTQLGIPSEIALSTAIIQRLFSPGLSLVQGLISANILGVSEMTKTQDV